MQNHFHATFTQEKFYHIFNRSIGNESLFRSNRNKNFFLKKYHRFLSPYIETWAWVLMGNHFHLAVRVKKITEDLLLIAEKEETQRSIGFCENGDIDPFLTDQFKRLFSSYSQAYNKENGRRGSLFQKGFKRIQVGSPSYLRQLIHYIHMNPVHHGMTDQPDEWQYSSYKSIFSEKSTKVNRASVQKLFNQNRIEFEQYHEEVIEYNKAWAID